MPLTHNPFIGQARALQSRLLTLPIKVGDTSVLFIKQRFAQSNWIGNNTQPWRTSCDWLSFFIFDIDTHN